MDQFAQKKREAPKPVVKKEEAKPTKQCFSQPDRQRNVNIVLNKLHLDPVQIADALIEYNPEVLTPAACDLLMPIFPTDLEFKTISDSTANFESEDDYDQCDLFIILIGSVVAYKQRLGGMVFKLNYRLESVEILKLIDYFFKGFDLVSTNEHLRQIFEIMLAHGNYMNGITAKGGAFGFRLDSLSKILEMKSKDNKTTLLQYIVNFIIDDMKKPDILDIMPFLQLFEKMQMKTIQEAFKELANKFKEVSDLKKLIEKKKEELDPEDQSEQFLESFYPHAQKTITYIDQKIKAIDDKYAELAKFFGEDVKSCPLEKFVGIFKTLYNELMNALKKYKEMKEKKEKEEKKKKKKAARKN